MKVRKRIKRTTKQYFIVAFICIAVIGGAAIFTSVILTGQIKEEYQVLLSEAYSDMKNNQRTVYVASADIMAGDYISLENVVKKTVYASQPEDSYISEEGIGKVAMLNISTGTQLINSMLTENAVSSEVRESEYDVINIGSNIKNNDTVDVRIFYPNGESYVVLSKKVMKGFLPEVAICCLWLDEEELLRMSAAIVDAGLYPGTILYVTKYIEPSIQQASAVTYTPSLTILSLLESDPNVVERYSQELNKGVRKALENRLADSMEIDVSNINWDIRSNDNFITEHTPDPKVDTIIEPTAAPTQIPQKISDEMEEQSDHDELGMASEYFYYAEEDKAREGIVEYGE